MDVLLNLKFQPVEEEWDILEKQVFKVVLKLLTTLMKPLLLLEKFLENIQLQNNPEKKDNQ